MTDTTITMHRDGFGPGRPAVNVKVHRSFGGPDAAERIAERYSVSEAEAERVLEMIYESHQSQFWDDLAPNAAEEQLSPVFTDRKLVVYGEGRSSGWLVVEYAPIKNLHGAVNNLPDVEEWTPAQVAAWAAFEEQIDGEIKYLCEFDTIIETIDANEWLATLNDRAAAVVLDFAD